MATPAVTLPKTKGGAFLIEERSPHEIFTPEDLLLLQLLFLLLVGDAQAP